MRILKALGAIAILCALAALSHIPAHADGGAAQYRWVSKCNSTYGPSDAAAQSVITFDQNGNLCTSSGTGLPAGAVMLTASATGTTAATTATLAGVANKTTFICGFTMTSGGTTSAVVADATVAGTISGTLHFAYVSVSSGQGAFGIAFPLCIPASAPNTSIGVTEPAGGTGTVSAVTAWGYQL